MVLVDVLKGPSSVILPVKGGPLPEASRPWCTAAPSLTGTAPFFLFHGHEVCQSCDIYTKSTCPWSTGRRNDKRLAGSSRGHRHHHKVRPRCLLQRVATALETKVVLYFTWNWSQLPGDALNSLSVLINRVQRHRRHRSVFGTEGEPSGQCLKT